MPDRAYPVEVQPDFLQKVTQARPLHALSELIWNRLDADATSVRVETERNELGALNAISIIDDGIGMQFSDAPQLLPPFES